VQREYRSIDVRVYVSAAKPRADGCQERLTRLRLNRNRRIHTHTHTDTHRQTNALTRAKRKTGGKKKLKPMRTMRLSTTPEKTAVVVAVVDRDRR
jgi:hypothetical protein